MGPEDWQPGGQVGRRPRGSALPAACRGPLWQPVRWPGSDQAARRPGGGWAAGRPATPPCHRSQLAGTEVPALAQPVGEEQPPEAAASGDRLSYGEETMRGPGQSNLTSTKDSKLRYLTGTLDLRRSAQSIHVRGPGQVIFVVALAPAPRRVLEHPAIMTERRRLQRSPESVCSMCTRELRKEEVPSACQF